MNADERFTELWNGYLEGELDESQIAELRELVAGDDHLLRMAADDYQMHRLLGLVVQDRPSRQGGFVGETMARLPADENGFAEKVMRRLPQDVAHKGPAPRMLLVKRLLAVAAAVAIVVLAANQYFQRSTADREIATIAGLSGPLQWTGDGGRVFHDLSVGTKLPGGTVEGMTPGSWLRLELNDGSTVTLVGNSTLTFSDHGQKRLHLKEGNLSGKVRPQPAGRPMLIYTRSAMLEVVGTRFDVDAGLAATTLNVSEGKMRVRRLSDGNTVDVPAKHRVVAAADREMSPVRVPNSVSRWESQLHLGPEGTYGKWSPGPASEDGKPGTTSSQGETSYTMGFGAPHSGKPPVVLQLRLGPDGKRPPSTPAEEAKLGAIPFTTPSGLTIYTASFCVSRGDRPPVILQPGSRLRVRGHIASTNKVWLGLTVRHPSGEFAGRFQTIRPAGEFPSGQSFEVALHLHDFQLDPLLKKLRNTLPSAPFHLVVESFWFHTLGEQAGLEIAQVQLIPAGEDQS